MNKLYWMFPIVAWLLQLLMTLNSFSQVRFEEFITSVQSPFWFYHHQILSGLHVNVAWYTFVIILYKIFGFNLFTGRIAYLFIDLLSFFILSYLLKKFFEAKIAVIILLTLALSPTWLFINSLNMHMALTYHLLIVILLILIKIDFSRIRLSLILTGILFLLVMLCELTYQTASVFIPSLFIFYWLKLRRYNRYNSHKFYKSYILIAAIAFILPVIAIFAWVDNEQAPSFVGSRQLLIWDSYRNTGLFRGGGLLTISEETFSQNWTYLLTDFFVKGISGHYEVGSAEFSYFFPIITLAFVFIMSFKLLKYNGYKNYNSYKVYILLTILVMVFNVLAFSFTTALTLPGMNRMTPFLLSIYFLWAVCWWAAEKRKIRVIGGIWGIRVILGLLLLHHLIVYPINLIHLKDPSLFKVADWFDGENPQKSVEEYTKLAQKEDLLLDCRIQLKQGGACFYDFIYSSIVSSCEFNHLSCHQILGYSGKDNKFIPLSLDLWQKKYFDQ